MECWNAGLAGRITTGDTVFFRFVALVWLVIVPVIAQGPTGAQTGIPPLYAYSSVGDNQWLSDWFPIDSPATVEAQFEYLSKTYGIKRMYWRGEQDRIWLRYCQFRRENPLPYGWWMDWLRYLNDEVKTNELAVAAARKHRMEIYVFSGLFDHAAQGDVGGLGIFPYVGEDRLRLQHPEWCPVDRWGERVSPGPIEFCYPAARKALISRWLRHVTKYGYDGISFYTYIENFGLRYADEFGYNEPIVREFKRRYGVDIRTEPFDKEAWYRLRGEYVTQFLRELHAALAAKGKKLSMALERNNPNSPQVWGAITVDLPGAGRIYMDWQRWAEEGIVEELCVWGSNDVTLSKVMQGCKGRAVKLLVMTTGPFDKVWKPFTEAGVTILGFVAPKCGLDRVTLEPTSLKTLRSPDWRLRMQTLADLGAGALKAGGDIVATLAKDPHVLVRREALRTLGALKAQDQVALLEACLADKESSVRIMAANVLGRINGLETPRRLLAALPTDGRFQMREVCITSLVAMKEQAQPALIEGLRSASEPVREVCVRALGANGLSDSMSPLLATLRNDRDYRVRFYAIGGLTGSRTPEVIVALRKALDDPEATVHLAAATALGERTAAMSEQQRNDALRALVAIFRQFGQGCKRPDASWGWRVIGNALTQFGDSGKATLEGLRTQKEDRWLAWEAYQVLYTPLTPTKPLICEEQEANENHARYAPPFPGYRR